MIVELQALEYLNRCRELLEEAEATGLALRIELPHCSLEKVISVSVVLNKIASLEHQQEESEVLHDFDTENYDAVVAKLEPMIHQAIPVVQLIHFFDDKEFQTSSFGPDVVKRLDLLDKLKYSCERIDDQVRLLQTCATILTHTLPYTNKEARGKEHQLLTLISHHAQAFPTLPPGLVTYLLGAVAATLLKTAMWSTWEGLGPSQREPSLKWKRNLLAAWQTLYALCRLDPEFSLQYQVHFYSVAHHVLSGLKYCIGPFLRDMLDLLEECERRQVPKQWSWEGVGTVDLEAERSQCLACLLGVKVKGLEDHNSEGITIEDRHLSAVVNWLSQNYSRLSRQAAQRLLDMLATKVEAQQAPSVPGPFPTTSLPPIHPLLPSICHLYTLHFQALAALDEQDPRFQKTAKGTSDKVKELKTYHQTVLKDLTYSPHIPITWYYLGTTLRILRDKHLEFGSTLYDIRQDFSSVDAITQYAIQAFKKSLQLDHTLTASWEELGFLYFMKSTLDLKQPQKAKLADLNLEFDGYFLSIKS